MKPQWGEKTINSLYDEITTSALSLSDMQINAHNQAITKLIPPPLENENWNNLSGEKLKEDNPEVHEFHQASTRLIGPTVSIIILLPDDRDLQSKKRNCLEPKNRYDEKWILNREISISHPWLVSQFKKLEVPVIWKQNSLLKNHRCLTLKSGGTPDDFIIDISDKLALCYNLNIGLTIEYKNQKMKGE